MQKVLGIIVNDYPYGYGESFLADELTELSNNFDRILLFIPMSGKVINDRKPLFELPGNVFVVPIQNKYSIWQKVTAPLRIGPFQLIKLIREDSKFNSQGFSWGMFKVLMAYIAKERNFRKKLWSSITQRSLAKEGLVLYSYWFNEYTYSLFKLKKKHPWLRVYSRTHGWDIYYERHTPPYLPLRKSIIEGIDCTFTVSDQGRKYLVDKLRLEDSRVETFRLGVKGISSNIFAFKKNVMNILSISFILPIKHLELLIEALGKVEGIQINWFHIGGGEVYSNKIETLARETLGNRANINYEFKGTLSNADVISFLKSQSIDLFFNVSYDEGIPVSMMEALSAGIPIVGPSVGGIPEIVDHEENGFLLSDKPTSEEIVEVIHLYNRLTNVEIQRLRQNAVQTWKTRFNSEHNHTSFAKRLTTNLDDRYFQCSRCILDSKDYPEMTLNSSGVCNVCTTYDQQIANLSFTVEKAQFDLNKILNEIKSKGRNKKYDCLIGISGGIDSCYLAYLAKKWELRPLICHVDTGWNTTTAVQNIRNIVEKLELDLYTHVIDWTEMKDLQLAFLKASVVDIDLPIDNTIVATNYSIARKFGIKYILTGENMATEGWLPPNFNHNKNDLPNIYDIHKKFGNTSLKKIPLIGFMDLYMAKKIFGIKWISPLDYMMYKPVEAKALLTSELNWRDYGLKHSENLFTRFYQEYILPRKFKVNKHKAHLSTLICRGVITKMDAIKANDLVSYDPETLAQDRSYFVKKMDLTEEEFEAIMRAEPLPHTYYKSVITILKRLRPLVRLVRKMGVIK